MSLKSLINNQSIMIDDHKRGSQEVKNWDDKSSDIHIDKSTKYRINGKKEEVRIRIPINSEKDISVENRDKHRIKDVPKKLKKEINKAFANKKKRKLFINDLVEILDNFSSTLENVNKVKVTLERLSKHFDLKWTEQNIQNYIDDYLTEYTQIFSDEFGKQFYITINRQRIKISDVDNWTRQKKNIRR